MSISGLIHAYHMLAVNKIIENHSDMLKHIATASNNLARMNIRDSHKFLNQILKSAKYAERLNNKYKFIGGDLNA